MTENAATPPNNIEAEQALLGAILLNNEVLDRLPSELGDHIFYEPVHGRIFKTIRFMQKRGKLASAVTLKPYFEHDSAMAELGGVEYLARVAGATISISAAPDYAATLMDLWARREAQAIMSEALAEITVYDIERGADQVIEAAQSALTKAGLKVSSGPPFHRFAEALEEAARRTDQAFKADGKPLLGFGLERLDRETGGMMPADHIVVMAESSMGKTAFAINVADAVIQQGKSVLFASLEMSRDQIAHRMASLEMWRSGSPVEYHRLMTGQISHDEGTRFFDTLGRIAEWPVIFTPENVITLGGIEAAAQAAHRAQAVTDHPLGLIVVDYLQLVRVPEAKGATERVGMVAVGLKTLAKALSVPVISLSQMNQENKVRENKRPAEGDARQSGEIRESADLMLGLYREWVYLNRDSRAERDPTKRSEIISAMETFRHTVEILILKQRRGPLGVVEAWCDLAFNALQDEAPGRQESMAF